MLIAPPFLCYRRNKKQAPEYTEACFHFIYELGAA